MQGLSNDFYILSDVGLEIFNKEFQIDSLIISPHAIYLIEIKNFDGTLTFDTTHRQMIQTNNHQEKAYIYLLTPAEDAALRIINQEKVYEKTNEGDPQRRNKIVSTIMANVHDFSINVMEKYKLNKKDINPGTRCL